MDVVNNANAHVVRMPKEIARITLCGCVSISIYDTTKDWKPPTEEQIKNLHDMLNIDVVEFV